MPDRSVIWRGIGGIGRHGKLSSPPRVQGLYFGRHADPMLLPSPCCHLRLPALSRRVPVVPIASGASGNASSDHDAANGKPHEKI